MTDEPDDQLGSFRTPLAAGMLSGVLTGLVMITRWYIDMRLSPGPTLVSTFAGFSIRDVLDIPWNTLLCSGPAIMHRRWRLVGYALLCALVLLVVGAVMLHMRFWSHGSGSSVRLQRWTHGGSCVPPP